MSFTNVQADPERIRLHFSPGTRAVRVRWVLEEIGVPYQLSVVNLRRGAHKSKDYLKIHPLGKVPAIEIDNTIIFESLGICLYLADRFVHADEPNIRVMHHSASNHHSARDSDLIQPDQSQV